MKLIDVWVNCPDTECAHRIADALITERLVACSNLFSRIDSCFRWKEKTEREEEYPLLLKTRAENFDVLAERVEELHPYETPSVIGIRVEHVNDEYLKWVYEETKDFTKTST